VTLPEQERHYEDRQIRLERRSTFLLAGYIWPPASEYLWAGDHSPIEQGYHRAREL